MENEQVQTENSFDMGAILAEVKAEGKDVTPEQAQIEVSTGVTQVNLPATGDKQADSTPVKFKAGDTRQTEKGEYEAFDGKDWKAAPAPMVPWKDGEKEYHPDQLRKALEVAENLHKFEATVRNKSKDIAAIERSLDPMFKLAESLSGKSEALAELREVVADAYGEDTAKLLDAISGIKKSELKDPREEEYSQREAALQAREDNLMYLDKMDKLQSEHKLTDSERNEFDTFCGEYYERMGNNESLPFLEPEDLFVKSPLYEKKIEERIRTKAETEAAAKKKREDEAAELKKRSSPKPSVGAGLEMQPSSWEDLMAHIKATVPES